MSNGIYVYVHHCFFVNNQFSAKKKIKYKKKMSILQTTKSETKHIKQCASRHRYICLYRYSIILTIYNAVWNCMKVQKIHR